MRIFVLDKNLKPLDPCHPARARELLKKGRAAVFKKYPFTIVLKDRTAEDSVVHSHRIKLDPGSKTTGIAMVQEETGRVTNALEIQHRGQQIKNALNALRALRRGRRHRKTRYRQPRFFNRTRPSCWLPPSLASRIANILTWVERLRKLCPIAAIVEIGRPLRVFPLTVPDVQVSKHPAPGVSSFSRRVYSSLFIPAFRKPY